MAHAGTGRALRAATRGSPLARWQTDRVVELLGVPVKVVVVQTEGDRRTSAPIWELGGRGVFVKEVQAAVLDGRADFAVHSAKDLPASAADPRLVIAAVPERGDPRDALVGSTLDGLGPGALVATGSVRRRAQLAWLRPDLTFTGLRGTIATRLRKAGGYGAIVMAAAALRRLDLEGEVAEVLEPSVMLPQVGQGALAVECRADDGELRERLAGIDHRPSRLALEAERAFLATLGGGCDVPVGAYARVAGGEGGDAGDGGVDLEGLMASLDGRVLLRAARTGPDPAAVGRELATHLLDHAGGRSLLADWR